MIKQAIWIAIIAGIIFTIGLAAWEREIPYEDARNDWQVTIIKKGE